jgi:hypothetical protein
MMYVVVYVSKSARAIISSALLAQWRKERSGHLELQMVYRRLSQKYHVNSLVCTIKLSFVDMDQQTSCNWAVLLFRNGCSGAELWSKARIPLAINPYVHGYTSLKPLPWKLN